MHKYISMYACVYMCTLGHSVELKAYLLSYINLTVGVMLLA